MIKFFIVFLLYTSITFATIEPNFLYISGDNFRRIANFIIDENTPESFLIQLPRLFKDGHSIFVKTDLLSLFFTQIHPKLKGSYILITHNSDKSVPGKFKAYLEKNPKLIAWFAKNPDCIHPKLIPIPIGIPSNRYYNNNNGRAIFNAQQSATTKNIFLYVNFDIDNNPREREQAYRAVCQIPYCYTSKRKPYEEYLEDLKRSVFVVSPFGSGQDCYRTWETLLMGAIPIVKSSSFNQLYTGLPVLVVNEWKEVTYEFLQKQLSIFAQKTYAQEKLFFEYWKQLIQKTQANYIITKSSMRNKINQKRKFIKTVRGNSSIHGSSGSP